VTAEFLLHFDGANRRVDLDLRVKLGVVSLTQIFDKVARPGTAVAPVWIKPRIDSQRRTGTDRDQGLTLFEGFEFVVVLNSWQVETIDFFVLAEQGIMRRAEHRVPANAACVMFGGATRTGRALGGVAVQGEGPAADSQSQECYHEC
jgi:hypothetical protein